MSVDAGDSPTNPPTLTGRISKLFNVTRDLLAVVTFDGHFETASPSWTTTLGWSLPELTATPIWQLIHPDDLEEATRVAQAFVASGGHLLEFRNRYRCKDGTYRMLAWSNYTDVETERVYCVARDVTELQGEATELVKLFTMTDDLIAVGPGEGVYDILSPSWTKVLGWTKDELKSMDIRRLVHPEDLAGALATADRMRAEFEPVRQYDARFRCKDGSYRHLSWTGYVDATDGRTYSIGRDVTELAARTASLNEQAEAWEAFGYTLAHDVRSPIRSIGGLADLLRRGTARLDDPEVQRCLNMILARTKGVDAMTSKLLAFAKSGSQALEDGRVDMQQVFLENLDLVREAYADEEVEFHVGHVPPCTGDATLLGAAVANLLQNACKFSTEGKAVIAISGEIERDRVTYSIADNGVGFDEAMAKRIWNPMVRGHSKEAFKGAGLGLATVKRIIEHHNGTVSCTSEVGEGSVFSFSLPLADPDPSLN